MDPYNSNIPAYLITMGCSALLSSALFFASLRKSPDVRGEIEIGGQERKLFFERLDQMYPSRVGRWFVEKNGA